jgi:hypothetical protein
MFKDVKMSKICSKCKIDKPSSAFSKQSSTATGLRSRCKSCVSEDGQINAEKINAQNAEYYIKNKEKINLASKLYRQNNKEKMAESGKSYRLKNKEKAASYQKIYSERNKSTLNNYSKNYYLKNKDYFTKRGYLYRENNKEKITNINRLYLKNNAQKIYAHIKFKKKSDYLFDLKLRIRIRIAGTFSLKGYTKKSKTFEILGCSFDEFKAHIENQFVDGMSFLNRSEWHLDHIIPIALAKNEEEVIKLNHYTNFQPLWAVDNLRKGCKIIEPLAN